MFNIKAINHSRGVELSIAGTHYEVYRNNANSSIAVQGYDKFIILDDRAQDSHLEYVYYDVAYITLDGETVDTIYPPVKDTKSTAKITHSNLPRYMEEHLSFFNLALLNEGSMDPADFKGAILEGHHLTAQDADASEVLVSIREKINYFIAGRVGKLFYRTEGPVQLVENLPDEFGIVNYTASIELAFKDDEAAKTNKAL